MSTKKTDARTASKPMQIAPAKPQAPPQRELTEFQQYVCGLAGDIIVNGGDTVDLTNVLMAVIGHEYDLSHSTWPDDPKRRSDNRSANFSHKFDKWQRKLMGLWPDKPTPKDAPLPTTVSEAVRADSRGRVMYKFEEFLEEATPEETLFLCEVLDRWHGELATGPEPNWGTCALAEAFAAEIDRNEAYIRVPAAHKKDVIAYANMLLKASGTDERAY